MGVVQEKEAASTAASAAASAAKKELRDLESWHGSARIRAAGRPLKKIIRLELNIIQTRLFFHEEQEKQTLEAERRCADVTVAETRLNYASGVLVTSLDDMIQDQLEIEEQ